MTESSAGQWHMVEFDGDEGGERFAADLLLDLNNIWRETGMPKGVEVWHRKAPDGGLVYYLSPQASIVGKQLLTYPGLGAAPCPEPTLEGCMRVHDF